MQSHKEGKMRSKNQIRIASGTLGGRVIETPRNKVTQPMGERERLAIFNQIRPYLAGAAVLDAFAGSGSLGITAISDGAASADFFEADEKAMRTIQANLKHLNLTKQGKVIRRVVGKYDVIFADPPYDNPQYARVEAIAKHVKPGGIFVLSHPGVPEPPEFIGLALISDRNYAAAHIKIYQAI